MTKEEYFLPLCHGTLSIDLEELTPVVYASEDELDQAVYNTDFMNVNTYLSKEDTEELIKQLMLKVEEWPQDEYGG